MSIDLAIHCHERRDRVAGAEQARPGRHSFVTGKVTQVDPPLVTTTATGDGAPAVNMSNGPVHVGQSVVLLILDGGHRLILGSVYVPGFVDHNHDGVYATDGHQHTAELDGAGGSFGHGNQAVSSDTVVSLSQFYSEGSYGDGAPYVSAGRVRITPGVWTITSRARLTGTGASTRFNTQLFSGGSYSGFEISSGVGTHVANHALTLRTLQTLTVYMEMFQNSGNTKYAGTTTLEAHRITRV